MYPKEFLYELDQQQLKTVYARVIALTIDESPIQTIEGRITSGSIGLDGASAIRRTCQISMITPEDINISDYYWGLNTKIKLSIGVQNNIDTAYPDIIWFEQGVFIITSFNSSYSSNSYTINLSGKDKMCLLNGEVAGSVNSSVDFGSMEQEISPGVWKKIKLPVKDIIREMVHTYAREPFHNILINDLEDKGLILQEYKYDKPMFLLRRVGSNEYTQGFINENQQVSWSGWTDEDNPPTLGGLEAQGFKFDELTDNFINSAKDYDKITWNEQPYYVAKIDYGETAGYTETDLVYPGDLIANIGESITSVLDKIKNLLGEFEYFYNLQGQFVFQKKKTYIQTDWSPLTSDGEGIYVEDLRTLNGNAYIFNSNEFFTAFNNTPNLGNVKNDFSVWGQRGSSNTPIHMRYAIDKKPMMYRSIKVDDNELQEYNKKHELSLKGQSSHLYIIGTPIKNLTSPVSLIAETDNYSIYYDEINESLKIQVKGVLKDETLVLQTLGVYDSNNETLTIDSSGYTLCDWREIIYRMALDYSKYNHLDNFEQKITEANQSIQLYSTGRTGYEQYYIDLEGFWRQLYDPFTWDGKYTYNNLKSLDQKILEVEEQLKESSDAELVANLEVLKTQRQWLLTYYDSSYGDKFGWARAVYEQPEQLLFWFDFLDTEGDLKQFSVPILGARPKVSNDKQVKAIYYRETPNVIFQTNTASVGSKSGYRYFNYPAGLSMFARSSQGKSAKEEIDNLLYNHGYCAESVSITSIPIYHLDVNTRIYIDDAESNVKGEYIISKISLPLAYNGTMNITATKAPERLL